MATAWQLVDLGCINLYFQIGDSLAMRFVSFSSFIIVCNFHIDNEAKIFCNLQKFDLGHFLASTENIYDKY